MVKGIISKRGVEYPTIEAAISDAAKSVESGSVDFAVILESVRVVKRAKLPVTVEEIPPFNPNTCNVLKAKPAPIDPNEFAD